LSDDARFLDTGLHHRHADHYFFFAKCSGQLIPIVYPVLKSQNDRIWADHRSHGFDGL